MRLTSVMLLCAAAAAGVASSRAVLAVADDFAVTGAATAATAATAADVNPKQLEDAAGRLGDPDPGVRDAAEKALRDAGADAAGAALRGAAESGDPEAARRARALLRELGAPVPADPPYDDPPELSGYRTADRDAKQQHIDRLAGAGGYRAGVLARLWAEEEDAELRGAMFAGMLQAPSPHASALLAQGNAPAAERLLEAALAQGGGDAAASYAALCLLRGRLDAAIRDWSARPVGGPANGANHGPAGNGGGGDDAEGGGGGANASAVLARLYRAAGDAKAAASAAHASGEAAVLEAALVDAGDWASLAALLESRATAAAAAGAAPGPRGPAQPNFLGLAQQRLQPRLLARVAAAYHLAGDAAGFAGAVERLRKLAAAGGKGPAGAAGGPDDATGDVARVLLLCGRPDDAAALLAAEARYAPEYVKLLATRERWDELWRFVESRDGARDEAAMRLRVAAAEQWYGLGEDERAVALLDRVAKENAAAATPSNDVVALVAEAYRECGAAGKAWAHFRTALEADGTPQGQVNRVAWRAFHADADGDDEADFGGGDLWNVVRERRPGDGFEKQFEIAKSVADGTLPLEELKPLLAWDRRAAVVEGGGFGGRGGAARRREEMTSSLRLYATNMVRLVGQRLKDAGKHEEAEQYLSAAAAKAPAPFYAANLYLRLGDWAGDAGDWAKASDWYGRAWNADRNRPAPLYLRAWALQRGGWHARAAELMRLAHELPLAEADGRIEPMRVLYARGLRDLLAAESAVVLRTGMPASTSNDMALHFAVDRAEREGDWDAAAAARERSILNYAGAAVGNDAARFLRMNSAVRRYRAQGALAKGDVEAAEREIAAARALFPGDISLAIDVVPAFERRGDKARADALYAEAMAAQDAVLAKHPNAANHHNNAAWLAVTCGRDLDKALAHARRATEVRPDNAAYLDTLAEVQFRRGEVDAAITSISRCVESEPRTARHREQLERFEAGKRGEVRAMPPG